MIKVLINCPSDFNLSSQSLKKIGGIETLNVNLAKILSKKKINVTLSSYCKKSIKKNNVLNLPVDVIKKHPNKYVFDSIISSNDSSIFNYFPNSKKFLWLHNPLQIEKSLRKKQFFHIIRNKPTVVFVSNYLKSITSRIYPFKKRVVIKNFLSSAFTTKLKSIRRKPIFVWSVQRDKGLSNTIDMWINKIYPISKNAEFYILGINKLPGKYKLELLKSKNIIFLGRVSKKKLKEIYTKSTAMICLGYDETFCLNALEANSCGLPVLTFGKTALSELIKNNFNGYVVNNFNQLSTKILFLLKLNLLKKKILTNNSIFNSKKYNPKIIAYSWLKLLK